MLKAGDVVEGRYKILDTIDEGGMGTVLLAEHILIKRRLAIKLLHEDLASDPAVVERFMNEASVAGRLGHPNIVESTDMGFVGGRVPFIVFEYLEGALLTHEIYKASGLTVRRALKIANQIAAGLDAAHAAGIVHRDLKTDNIFLCKRDDVVDHVKVLDFGVSRFLEADDAGIVVGTPEYMAPEQILTPDKVDARADIYALGIVLYEMITARRPFLNDGDTQALLQRIVSESPPPLTRGEAPIGLQEMLFTKLLAKDPADRYQTMKDVQGAIAAFTGITRPTPLSVPVVEVPAPAPPPKTPTPRPPTDAVLVPNASKRRGSPVVLVVAGIAAIGTGVGLLFVPPERTKTGGTDPATIATDAQQIQAALEASASANLLRAESLAMTPMVRAAIETDAATFADMVKTGDFVFEPKPGETVEIYAQRPKPTLLVRIPEDATPIGPIATTRYIARDGAVVAIAGAPIKAQVAGLAVVATVVDLAPAKQRIAEHAVAASITGLEAPVPLVSTEGQGVAMTAPIRVPGDPVLDVRVPAPVITEDDRFATLRVGLWGGGGAILVLYLSLLLFRRR